MLPYSPEDLLYEASADDSNAASATTFLATGRDIFSFRCFSISDHELLIQTPKASTFRGRTAPSILNAEARVASARAVEAAARSKMEKVRLAVPRAEELSKRAKHREGDHVANIISAKMAKEAKWAGVNAAPMPLPQQPVDWSSRALVSVKSQSAIDRHIDRIKAARLARATSSRR